MQKIIYTQQDGILAVVVPSEGARMAHSITLSDGQKMQSDSPKMVDQFLQRWPIAGAVAEWAETESEFVARICKKDVPASAMDVQIIDEAAVPKDRTFRDGWKVGIGKVEHDMTKCKAIAHQRRRARRADEFAPLDVEATIPARAAQAEAKRQVIRDKYAVMQQAIDAAQTVEALKDALK